jgi:hypothetical protein
MTRYFTSLYQFSEILIRPVLVPLDCPDPDRKNYSFVKDPVFMSNSEIPIHFTIKLPNPPFKSAKFCLMTMWPHIQGKQIHVEGSFHIM